MNRLNKRNGLFNKPVNIILICLFMAMICIPFVQMKLRFIPELKNVENRPLTEKPVLTSISLSGFVNYKSEYEKYFNDNFGLRNFLIRINNYIDIKIFKTISKERVVVGKNGWLYYNDPYDGKNLRDFIGQVNFTMSELAEIKKETKRLDNEFRKRGMRFIIVMAPGKHTVYPEYLPDFILKQRSPVTRVDQVKEELSGLGVTYIDLRDCLLEAKTIYPHLLFFITDTHWNLFGSFIAYMKLVPYLKTENNANTFYSIQDFNIVEKKNNGLGDLALFSSTYGMLSDTEVFLEPLKKQLMTICLLDSYAQQVIVKNNPDKTLPKLLMFRDSFGVALIPYLSASFSECKYIRTHTIDFNLVDREKPDIVILEFAERNAGILLP